MSDVRIAWTEMDAEQRAAAMAKARWNVREKAPATAVPATTRVVCVASGKGGVGKSSVTVNLAVALRRRVTASVCSTPTSGASRSPAWSASTVAWRR